MKSRYLSPASSCSSLSASATYSLKYTAINGLWPLICLHKILFYHLSLDCNAIWCFSRKRKACVSMYWGPKSIPRVSWLLKVDKWFIAGPIQLLPACVTCWPMLCRQYFVMQPLDILYSNFVAHPLPSLSQLRSIPWICTQRSTGCTAATILSSPQLADTEV